MNNLKETREKIGATQATIAAKIGIAKSAYQNYEAGRHEPTILTAIRIADALDVKDVRELWG